MSWCEIPEFYAETFPKARKPHRCVECLAPIEIGERHLHYRGRWSGGIGFDEGRQHMLCREACMFIRDNYEYGECIGFGELFNHSEEVAGIGMILGERVDNNYRLSADDLKFRSMMAKIKWRQRKRRREHIKEMIGGVSQPTNKEQPYDLRRTT